MTSLPGLTFGSSASKKESTTITLEKQSEWRFEVPYGRTLKIKVLEGTAEIFGTELPLGVDFNFQGTKAAVYSWHGCVLEYVASGQDISEYTSDATPVPIYANLHFALQSLRASTDDLVSKQQNIRGPSVLLLGPQDCGKTSLAKTLVSYANKQQSFPMLVNLDPTEGVFAVPGALSAAPISDILDVEAGWGASPTNGPSPIRPKQPLVYSYGLESPLKNIKYYKQELNRLGVGVAARMAADSVVNGSGIIIDTPYHVVSDKTQGYSIVSNIVADFGVSVIVVVGHEKLFADMQKRFKDRSSEITIIKVPKSGGCVERDEVYMRKVQSETIQQYFYGSPKHPLAPFTATVDYSVVTVYRVAEESVLNNDSVLPIGQEDSRAKEGESNPEENGTLIKVDTSAILQNCVLAVLDAARFDSVDVIQESETIGFVHVVEADDAKHKLKILMPVPGRLPDKPFLMGDYRYHE